MIAFIPANLWSFGANLGAGRRARLRRSRSKRGPLRNVPWLMLGMLIGVAAPGCEEQPQPPAIERVQGTISKIDLKRRTLTLTFFRKDKAQNEEILARVPPECEIHVLGIVTALDRLRVGQMITAFATVESFADGDLHHLLKIHLSEPAPTGARPSQS